MNYLNKHSKYWTRKDYLQLYQDCMETGMLPTVDGDDGFVQAGGLCEIWCYNEYNDLLELFEPTQEDCLKYDIDQNSYWGSGQPYGTSVHAKQHGGFTELRQTIILFMAQMVEDEKN